MKDDKDKEELNEDLVDLEGIEVVTIIRYADGSILVDTQLDEDIAIALLARGITVLTWEEMVEDDDE